MLTPHEVAQHTFGKASFGGYRTAMVDDFLDILTRDYTALYKENAALKAKMKVLADKVEDYRATEDAMRKALLAAQKMAEQIVSKAQTRGDTIVSEAEKEAAERLRTLRQETEDEQFRLAAAQKATAEYVEGLQTLLTREQDYLSNLAQLRAEPKKPDHVADAAKDIGSAVEKAVEDVSPSERDQAFTDMSDVTGDISLLRQPDTSGSAETEEADKLGDRVPDDVPEESDETEDTTVFLHRLSPDKERTERLADTGSGPSPAFQNLRSGKDYEIS